MVGLSLSSMVSCSGTAALIVLGGTRCSSDWCLHCQLTDVSTFLCGKPIMIDTISLAVRYYFGVLKSQHLLWEEERGDCCTRVPGCEWGDEGCQACCCCCDHPDSFSSLHFDSHEPGGGITLITCWATSNKHLMAGSEETKKIFTAAKPKWKAFAVLVLCHVDTSVGWRANEPRKM